MSTDTTDSYIPDEENVPTPQREKWRIADGKIVTGRAEDGSLKEREKIVGRLRRISVQDGTGNNGFYYKGVEADIETANGMIRFGIGITDKSGVVKPSVSGLAFMQGICDVAKDELIMITAGQSLKKNAYGTFTSYTNVFHLAMKDGKPVPIETKRHPQSHEISMDVRFDALAEEWAKHPAYKVRVREEEEDATGPAAGVAATHLAALEKECKAKGWPAPSQAPAEWLTMLGAFFKHPVRPSAGSYDDHEWGIVREALGQIKAMPVPLEPAKKRLESIPSAPQGVSGDTSAFGAPSEYDPFATP